MRSLIEVYRVSSKDKYKNIDVRKRCGLKEDIVTRIGTDPRPANPLKPQSGQPRAVTEHGPHATAAKAPS
ncbi:hypothetical protein EVAR_17493_1 [Eumeta japonica]|uniref:Uncharacterized protein n=1 Tax=Eumeta variegata TaxID=151549 RepID=A0A4C1ZHS0_EUMVA|nr:hypothetical protein EVAR_17493_1 [Eumeta japonica]